MMKEVENKQLMNEIFDGFSRGDSHLLVKSLSENVCWKIMGSTKFSGVYASKREVEDRLFARLSDELDGSITVIADRIFADGDYVVVEAHSKAQTRTGNTYNNQYCSIYRIENKKIEEITEYLDTEIVNVAFGRD